ncbi:hypothetical protein ACOSQ4_019118 [Xanthoceras sorbifolium]
MLYALLSLACARMQYWKRHGTVVCGWLVEVRNQISSVGGKQLDAKILKLAHVLFQWPSQPVDGSKWWVMRLIAPFCCAFCNLFLLPMHLSSSLPYSKAHSN